MSFLAGRLAATEGAYFLQESKHAVDRIIQKKKMNHSASPPYPSSHREETQADVLHDILRHSLPSKILQPLSDSSLANTSKWVLPHDPTKVYSLSADALNPLRAYVSLPQVTFGPKRWQLREGESSVKASTANDLRVAKVTIQANSDKLKAAEKVSKPFAIATTVVFGGSTLMLGIKLSNMDIHDKDRIRAKGRDLIAPNIENIKKRLVPLQIWVQSVSKKWHYERDNIKNKTFTVEISKNISSK